jgi:ubiquitin C-terminal hydrolase
MSKKINYCGLNNLGNTCFMNTFLQCLMSIDDMNDYFLSKEYIEDLSKRIKYNMKHSKIGITDNALLIRAYGNMLVDLMRQNVTVYDPKTFHMQFQKINTHFQGFQQQDCVEALTMVLDAFHESTKYDIQISVSGDAENDMDRLMISYAESMKVLYKDNYSKFYELFNAEIRQCIVCKEDDRNNEILSSRFDPYTMTLLDIPKDAETIYDCLDEFFGDESLDEDNLYYDEKTKRKVKADIQKKYIHLPEYLIISFKRFKQNQMGFFRKNNQAICIPFGEDLLDLSEYTEGYEKDVSNYDLHCIGLHSGNMNGGHYYAYCKNPSNGKFYEYNDSSVTLIDLEEKKDIIHTNGYLFIYKKYYGEIQE